MTDGATIRPDPWWPPLPHALPPPPPRASLPPLRRATDRAPFEQPAFWGALGAALDHVVDEAQREQRPPALTFEEVEGLCRLFLVHFIALGGRL